MGWLRRSMPMTAAVTVLVAAVGIGAFTQTRPAQAVAVDAGAVAARAAVTCGPTFTDRLDHRPWPLERLRPDLVWPLTRGRGVTVSVIDSGVSTNHPDLKGQVLPGMDYVTAGGAGDCDNAGHGTLVAGIIAGHDAPGSFFSGIAPDARILPVRVLADTTQTTDQAKNQELSGRIAQAIRWATDHDADVINLSLVTVPTPELEAAIKYAESSKVVVVAAAGNHGSSAQAGAIAYPAAYPTVMAVGGVDENSQHVAESNVGDYVDIAAPGSRIEGPAPNGNGYVLSKEGGTSYAAAFVSGVVALIRAYNSALSPADIRNRLRMTADAPPDQVDGQVGYGVVNAYRAVSTVFDGPAATNNSARVLPAPAQGADDPERATRIVAFSALGVAVALVVVLLVVVPLLRRGRIDLAPDDLAARVAAPHGESWEPTMGPMYVSSPSVRRAIAAPPSAITAARPTTALIRRR